MYVVHILVVLNTRVHAKLKKKCVRRFKICCSPCGHQFNLRSYGKHSLICLDDKCIRKVGSTSVLRFLAERSEVVFFISVTSVINWNVKWIISTSSGNYLDTYFWIKGLKGDGRRLKYYPNNWQLNDHFTQRHFPFVYCCLRD